MKISYILPVNMQRFGYTKDNYLDSHFSIQIAREIAKKGFNVSVHTLWSHNDYYSENNLQVFFYKTSLPYIFKEDFAEVSFELLNKNFDKDTVIHFSEPLRVFFPLFIWNKRNKLIIQHHGEGIVRPFPIYSIFYIPFIIYTLTFLLKLINKGSYLIVSNKKAQNSFIKLGYPKDKLINYHRGLDISRYKDFNKKEIRNELQIDQKKIVYIFIGRISKNKGINELIDAFNEVKNKTKDVDLILLGPLEDSSLETIVKPYWKGFKNTNELQKWLFASDVFVLPSYYEAFGIVLVQALFYNLPIIATNVGGIPEFVPKNKAVFIKPKSVTELKEAMIKMLDKNFRKSKSSSSREMVIKKFSWKNIAEKYIKIYKSAINT